MAQSIHYDRYPKFVADQVLTEKSLNQMFGYLEEQQRLTRTTLIGIGILCGMEISVKEDGTALTISGGVGVTSKGYLVPIPETTYTLYNDGYSAEQEFFYKPFLNADNTQKFPLNLLHNDGAAEIQKPLSSDFLEDKVVVIFVELLKVDNKNCDPDSCDDKGCTVEVTHRPLLVARKNIDDLIFNVGEVPFRHEAACVEWPELKMPKYNVPATYILSSPAVLKNFLELLNSDFIFGIENVLTAAYGSFGYYIRDEYPNNPFSGLRNSFSFLFNGSISSQQLLHIQYYYDFFSDLIMAYEELRTLCNNCLSLCCPNEALFPRHLILGNAIGTEEEFRHHWISSPAFACGSCSQGRITFLLKKIVLLLEKLNVPRTVSGTDKKRLNVEITPSKYGDIPLSDKAIPYYYPIIDSSDELLDNWNFKKTKLGKGYTNLSYDAPRYTSDPLFSEPLDYDLERFNFLRVEGHIGMNWKTALAEINKIRYQKRLPFDVVALNGDIFALIQSLLTSTNSLQDILSGNKDIADDIRCYFEDVESQYDAHAAELRCTLIKVMAYFYNLVRIDSDGGLVATTNLPQSDLVRKEFPNYRTFDNTYGEEFDKFYAPLKGKPYITPQAFIASVSAARIAGQGNLLSPIYLMYYLEKIYEALPDGLVKLQINTLTERLEDASEVAFFMLLALDNLPEFDLPVIWEESLDAVIRICKAEVFKVLFRNFLINYVLFIANQTFAMYAFKNSGVQHKAGVTTGGTLILVYNDKLEVRDLVSTNDTRAVTSVDEQGSTGVIFSDNPSIHENLTTHERATEGSTISRTKFKEAKASVSTEFGRNIKNPIYNYRNKEESVKAEGLNDIFEIAEGAGRAKVTDAVLVQLVDQFAEGTVIADFFVPNMCKSSCMSMNFMVMGDKEPPPGETKIVLDIKPREFCEDDSNNYNITIAPEGGILQFNGEEVDAPEFKPSTVPMGDGLFTEITITYEVNDDRKNIRVRVHKKPDAGFSFTHEDNVNRVVSFTNETEFADRWEWDFGNGRTSDKENPDPINFGKAQVAVVILKAFNGPCVDESQHTISFEIDPDGKTSCTPVNDLGEKFKVIEEEASDDFKGIIKNYDLLKSILIENFDNLVGLSEEEQCKLLMAELRISEIRNTLSDLNNPVDSKDVEYGLILLEIVTRITMFYACCQERDVNEARTPTKATFDRIVKLIDSTGEKVNKEELKFTEEEKKILEEIGEAVAKELEKTKAETPQKEVYIECLNNLAESLSNLLKLL